MTGALQMIRANKNPWVALACLWLGLALGGCAETSGAAEAQDATTAQIIATRANCRAAPDGAASIVTQIGYGTTVSVERRSGDWSEVEWDGQSCWVNNRLLGGNTPWNGSATEDDPWSAPRDNPPNQSRAPILGTSDAQIWTGAGTSSKRSRSATKRATTRSKRSSGSSRGYRLRGSGGNNWDSSCPCSGSNICIGPRGGRYCITSGGNKRYGV